MKKLIVSALALTMLTSGFGIAKMSLLQEKFNYQNVNAHYQQTIKESDLDYGTEEIVDTICKNAVKEEKESHLREVQISSSLDNDTSLCNTSEEKVETAQDAKQNTSDQNEYQTLENLEFNEKVSEQEFKSDTRKNDRVKVISKLEKENSEKVENIDIEERKEEKAVGDQEDETEDTKNADQIKMIENVDSDTLAQEQNRESENSSDKIDEQVKDKENVSDEEDKKSFKDLLEKFKKHSPKKVENAFREKVKPRKKEKLLSLVQNLSLIANADEGEMNSPKNETSKPTNGNKNIEKVQKENSLLNADNDDNTNTTIQKQNATILPSSDIKNSSSGVSTLADESQQDYCVTVIGNATSSMKPDKAYVTVQIETFDSDMKKSKDDNFALFDKITGALKDNGLNDSDIVFDSFYSYPNYDYSGIRTLNGYYCQTIMTFAVSNLENLQNLISVVSENGITKVSNIRYEVSTKDQVYSDVMLKALENAKEKAKGLTGKEDLSIKSIKEESVYSSSCLYKNYYEGANIADFLGDIEVEARVVVEFE